MDSLGDLYYNGGNGVSRDYKKAKEWFQKGADSGIAGSMYSLRILYQNAEGVRKSLDKAAEWYCSALHAGYTDAQVALDAIS
jgi:TPR repeat protein